MKYEKAMNLILAEYCRAASLRKPFNSIHEGYAVMLEEFDELWSEIKEKKPDHAKLQEETVQVGAMALRFLIDLVHG